MKTVKATIGQQKYKTELQAKNHIIIADEPMEVGGQNLGFTPTELLESALASCTSMTIRMYADKKEWDVQEIKIEVGFKRNLATHQVTFDKEIRIIGDLNDEQRTKLLEIGAKCPIEKMMTGDIVIQSQLV